MYSKLKGWPDKDPSFFVPVAVSLSLDASKFFEQLRLATSGLYFLESDQQKDLELTRGVDYRNSQPKGICLMLTTPFVTES